MNVLFLTMSNQMLKISANGIYTDLARRFYDEGHEVYVMMPFERRSGRKTVLFKEAGIHILGVQTLNVEKTNIIEKGLGQVMLEAQFKAALKKYLGHVRFDLILYSTPPITFAKVIEYAKRQNPQAVSYLMLKDIFPQNAVDLGLLKKNGLKGMLYRSFRKKEKKLYAISDVIGCMSLYWLIIPKSNLKKWRFVRTVAILLHRFHSPKNNESRFARSTTYLSIVQSSSMVGTLENLKAFRF